MSDPQQQQQRQGRDESPRDGDGYGYGDDGVQPQPSTVPATTTTTTTTATTQSQLPPEVAQEIATYLRSQLFAPISTNITNLKTGCEITISKQKDDLQEAQAQIANVIEPVAAELVPIARELEDVYRQIDLLEGLLTHVNTNIKKMASRVEKTEQTLRREERALDEGKPVEVWRDVASTGGGGGAGGGFRARDWIEGGILKER